jgi:hypothetical protein
MRCSELVGIYAAAPTSIYPSRSHQGLSESKLGDLPSPSAKWVTKAVFHKHQPFEMNLAYEIDSFREFLGLLLQCHWKKSEQISTSTAIAIARHEITPVSVRVQQCSAVNFPQASVRIPIPLFREHVCPRQRVTSHAAGCMLHDIFRHLQLLPIRPSLQGIFVQPFSFHSPSGEAHALDI